jgi:hypothetical protein
VVSSEAMERRGLALALVALSTLRGPAAIAAPDRASAQLEVREQALGWWLGGSGTVAMLAGAFMLAVSSGPSKQRATQIEFSGGVALSGLGAAVLGAGIFTLVAAAPGPCETSGTAISSNRSSWYVFPSGIGIGAGVEF